MSYPQNARVPVADRYWVEGCDSLSFPTDIAQGSYYWGENIVNRGGVIQTRPGRRLLFTLPGKRAQGLGFYRPYRDKEQLVWGIDGQIFACQYPFTTYHQLIFTNPVKLIGSPQANPPGQTGTPFWPKSAQVFFCQARQETKLNPDGSLTLLDHPRDLLFIQDGYSASCTYDATATSSGTIASINQAGAPFSQCPPGTVMVFMGGRLWVAYQETIKASDLLNPNSFTEGTYLAEADGFKLPEPCTGLLMNPQADPSQGGALLAFTPYTITALQAGILDRTQWQTTQGFQQIISSDYGNVSPFAPLNEYGLPWFFAEEGWISLNEALNQYRSSRVNPQDGEMTRSKMNMSPVRSGICSTCFGNFMLVGVPSGSKFNRHTWVMDGTPMSKLGSQAGPCYSGIWTGTFPVQFTTGEVQDVPRCFELSYSCQPSTATDGSQSRIQLWENFVVPRTDHNHTPISCSWETKIFEVSQIGELCRFKYCEIDCIEIIGIVEIQIYYAGIKGHYRLIHEVQLTAEEGMPGNENYPIWTYSGLVTDTEVDSFRPQSRTVRTPDYSGSQDEADSCADTCGVESDYQHNVDKGFQLLFNWQGRMGIRELRLFIEPYPQSGIGACTPSETGQTNIVSAIGCLPPPVTCGFVSGVAPMKKG